MKIPKRPALVSTTLEEHEGQADAPVFFYEPPRPADSARWMDEVFGLQEAVQELVEAEQAAEAGMDALQSAPEGSARSQRTGSILGGFCELFDRQIRRVDNLEIEDESFDPAKHLEDIPFGWKIAVGKEIFGRLKNPLTGLERGN